MTKVQEVQWSSFGSQGGFGSFSDFLSVLPPDACQEEDGYTLSFNSDTDLFSISEQSTSAVGSNVPERNFDDVAFFDMQQPRSAVSLSTAPADALQPVKMDKPSMQGSSQAEPVYLGAQGLEQNVQSAQRNQTQRLGLQLLDQEQQTQTDHLTHIHWDVLQLQGQEQQAESDQFNPSQLHTVQSQGRERQLQGEPFDRSQRSTLEAQSQERAEQTRVGLLNRRLWQEVAEYPGWLYNVSSGQWAEQNSYDGDAGTGTSCDFTGGQYLNQDMGGENRSSHWQGLEATVNCALPAEKVGIEETYLGQTAFQTSWGGDSDLVGQTNETHNALFQDTAVQQNGLAWQESTKQGAGYLVKSGWERQYPGWYYDYQAQDWKENGNQSPSLAADSLSLLSKQQLQYTDSHHQSEFIQKTLVAHNAPREYSLRPWSAVSLFQTQKYAHHVPQTPPEYVESVLRTFVGRPPHVLISFGFGGKLLVIKLEEVLNPKASDDSQSVASRQAWITGPVHVHSLRQLLSQTAGSGRGDAGSFFFGALCRSLPSCPLVGGNFPSRDLSKWLEERATNCQTEEPYSRSPGSLSMLWGLLKISCEHFGKLRSSVGTTGTISREEDGSEGAVARLLTSGSNQNSSTMESLSFPICLQPVPSEHQLQMTASEVTKLLISGKCKEALKQALRGQLWGPALVLARQLGEKYYTDTVAEMARQGFLPGSPLRTLSLLLAGQPAEVFNVKDIPTTLRKQPTQVPSAPGSSTEDGLGSMLEEWPGNLSIIAANRTSGDARVISHLGDCLWKVKGEVTAAHICYLVADETFETFSSSARLCLLGSDHWKNPRTYVTPEAIQRTEVYEYSKILGNPQFISVPFQPYKLIYAAMLAEAGKTTESLKYCQGVVKTLKIGSHAPEVETFRQVAASLAERLRIHTQSGRSVNLAPGKLVRGFLRTLDRSIHGIIGGPLPSSVQEHEKLGEPETLQDHLAAVHFGSNPNRSSPLVPSASAEKLKEPGCYVPQRSVSEPDLSTSMKENAEQEKPAKRGGYLGKFGSVFLKAGSIVSMVSKPSKNQAKLGDTNKFYYDETLKRWIEEGVEITPEELTCPPPPTSVAFTCIVKDPSHDAQFGASSGTRTFGTPPVPPTNQFSARPRHQGVRSRYVDTFNKGGNLIPSEPAATPVGRIRRSPPTMNTFVPLPFVDNWNGSISDSENENPLESSKEDLVGQCSDAAASILEEHVEKTLRPVSHNLFLQSGMSDSTICRVMSSDNTGIGALQRVPSLQKASMMGSGEVVQAFNQLGPSPSTGDSGFSSSYHSRANSWSGYLSNFQASQIETNSLNNSSVSKCTMSNGYPSESTIDTVLSAWSPDPLPAHVDIYGPNPHFKVSKNVLLPVPSTMAGVLMPGALEAGGDNDRAVALVADELQEVKL